MHCTFARRRGSVAAVAAAAAVALLSPAAPAAASVVYLYEESVSGDLGPATYNGGTPPIFSLGAGISVLTGTLSAGYDAFGFFSTDTDAFRFVVQDGFELVGISSGYVATATRGGQSIYVLNFLQYGAAAADGEVAEYFRPVVGGNGNEALFDVAAPFSPLGHRPTPAQMSMQLGFPSDVGNTSYAYQYALSFDVRRAAGNAVPEPGALALAAVALAAAAGGSGVRRRRRD